MLNSYIGENKLLLSIAFGVVLAHCLLFGSLNWLLLNRPSLSSSSPPKLVIKTLLLKPMNSLDRVNEPNLTQSISSIDPLPKNNEKELPAEEATIVTKVEASLVSEAVEKAPLTPPIKTPAVNSAKKKIPKPVVKPNKVASKAAKKVSTKSEPPKKPAEKPLKESANQAQASALLAQAQESIAKIQANHAKIKDEKALDLPTTLFSQKGKETSAFNSGKGNTEEECYQDELIQRLKLLMRLPVVGSVKIQLTLNREGQLLKLQIVEAESKLNRQCVEQKVPQLNFSKFGSYFPGEQEHTFSIIFSNDF